MPLTANWSATRRLLAGAALLTWLPRAAFLREAYSSAGVIVGACEIPVTNWFVLSPAQAWAVWGALIASLVTLLFRPSRVATLLYLAAAIVLMYTECLDDKAYDRLLTFEMLALAIAGRGAGEVGREARVFQILVFSAIYGSTGLSKLGWEPGWRDGHVLSSHLVDAHFGLRPLGLLAANKPWLLAPMGWATIAFETTFPALVWWPRVRRWLLLLGASFHLGILATMHVGTFSLVALAGYPVMASAEEWAWASERLFRWRKVLFGVALAWCAAAFSPVAAQAVWGPWPGAAWTPPDVKLHERLASDIEALAEGNPTEIVEAAWGGRTREVGEGARRVTLVASLDGKGADARTGLAVLMAIAADPPAAHVTLIAMDSPPALPPADLTVWVGPVGHVALQGGGQGWSPLASWFLTHQGTFLGISGPRAFAQRWAAISPVDVMWLPPGRWGPLGEGVIAVTDTGSLRGPFGKDDVASAIDVDQVARVVTALKSLAEDGSP